MSLQLNHLFKKIFLVINILILSACASVPGGPTEGDPFEPYNRAVFGFNEGLDKHLLKPVAEGYDAAIPDAIKTNVSNFFSNLDDIFVIINDLLQFKFTQAVEDTSRFAFNSTLGLVGLVDVATPMGLPKHDEDFGQTLAVWGVGHGPYIILPFFGHSTLRDTSSLIIENKYNPVTFVAPEDLRFGDALLTTTEIQRYKNLSYIFAVSFAIDARYKLLKASKIVDQAALDKYSFIRDAYLQQRENLIYDGNPPQKKQTPIPKETPEDLELEKELELDLEKSLGL